MKKLFSLSLVLLIIITSCQDQQDKTITDSASSDGILVQYEINSFYWCDDQFYLEIGQLILDQTYKGKLKVFADIKLTKELSLEDFNQLNSYEMTLVYAPYANDPDFLVDTTITEYHYDYDGPKTAFAVNWTQGSTISGSLYSFAITMPVIEGDKKTGDNYFWYNYEDIKGLITKEQYMVLTYAQYRFVQEVNYNRSSAYDGYWQYGNEKDNSTITSNLDLQTALNEDYHPLGKQIYDAVLNNKIKAYLHDSLVSTKTIEDVKNMVSYEIVVQYAPYEDDPGWLVDTTIRESLNMEEIYINYEMCASWEFDQDNSQFIVQPTGISPGFRMIIEGQAFDRPVRHYWVKINELKGIVSEEQFDKINSELFKTIISNNKRTEKEEIEIITVNKKDV